VNRPLDAARKLAQRRHFDTILLGSLVGAITALNLLWVSLDARPPYWDAARHLGDSIAHLNAFESSNPLHGFVLYEYYTPFAYWVGDLFYAVLGTGYWVSILSEAVFLAILVYSTYAIGKTLWSRRVGVLSAVFVVCTPMLTSLFKWYMLDAPLTAMVALALYLLIRSDFFSRSGTTILFGVVCGCGTLTKWTFPLCLWLPILTALVVAGTDALAERSLRRLVNVAAAGLIAFAIDGAWYIDNWSQLSADSKRYNVSAAAIEGDPRVGSLRSALWYLWNLLDSQLYAIPFVLFVIGVVVALRRRAALTRNMYPLLTIVGSYAAFTLLANKDYRYTLPMLPAVAVVAVSWLEYVRPRVRSWLAGGVVAYSVVTFLAVSFGTSLLPKDATIQLGSHSYVSELIAFMPGYNTDATRARGITFFAQHGWLVGPPSHERWYQEDVFREIAVRGGGSVSFYPAFPAGDSIWFNTWGSRYYALRYHEAWFGDLALGRFLIVRGALPPKSELAGFAPVATYALPDGEAVWLYQRA
jgi:4-amino-4-deoxy-L-arabinose transferase-like glycosyltransferase